MSFSNPAALWLLLLVPLLLLARRAQPISRRPVANLHLWRDAARNQLARPTRRFRVDRQALVQAGVVAAVVTALAEPTVGIGAHTVAVVLDTSLSMSARTAGGTRLDAAKVLATSVIGDLPFGTRVRLIEGTASARVVGEYAPSDPALQEAIDRMRATAAPADLEGAIAIATEGDAPAALAHVFTDGVAPPGTDAGAQRIAWTAVGEPADNAALTTLAFRRNGSTGTGTHVELLAGITNFGSTSVDTMIRVEQAGAIVASAPMKVSARQRATTTMAIPDVPGVVTARIDAVDAIPIDNERHLVLNPDRPLRVVFQGDSYFMAHALSTHPGVSLGETDSPDVVVCRGCPNLPDGDGGVILLPASTTGAAPSAALMTRGHELTEFLSLDGLTVAPIPTAQTVEDNDVVARAGGIPAILAYEASGRRVVELRFDPDTSALPLTPAFPLLLARALEWVASPLHDPTAVEAGGTLQWVLPSAAPSSIVGPDGNPLAATRTGDRLTFDRTSAPGAYRARLGDEEQVFVVNPATGRESNVAEEAAPALQGSSGSVQPVESGARLRTNASAAFLIIALSLLAIEWRLGRRPTAGRA